MKAYEVLKPGIVIDETPVPVGEVIGLYPKSGEVRAGLHFKQLKPCRKKITWPTAEAENAISTDADTDGDDKDPVEEKE